VNSTPDLQISVIQDVKQFAGLENDWHALHAQANSCFFMNWDWHYTWWHIYAAPNDKLFIVQFTKNGELIGLLPMYLKRAGILSKHILYFLGTGEAHEDEVATEYLDVLAHPDHEVEVADAAIDWLSQRAKWRTAELRCVLDEALLVQAYRRRSDLNLVERCAGFRYRVDLSTDEATHLEKFSKSKSKRIARSGRALEKAGGLKHLSMHGIPEIDQAFKQLTELNHERQEQKQRKSVFASLKFRQFHRELIERIFESGSVNIHQFKLGANVLAIIYCFYDDKTCYYYQSGFARKAANKYLPLTFAHLSEIQTNRENGRQYYDLMRAQPPTYKSDFGCETTRVVNTYLFSRVWHMRFFQAHRKARRYLVAALARFADVEELKNWGANGVVSLIEPHEFVMNKNEELPKLLQEAGIWWRNLPIIDMEIPSQQFEDEWAVEGERIRHALRIGERVIFHCYAGLGRTGMIAARILVELGMDAESAIKTVRASNSKRIQTSAQSQFVRLIQPL